MNAKLLARLPSEIQLGYKTFTVKVIEANDCHDFAGRMDFLPGVISIAHDRNYADHEMVNTVIHEPMHAIWRLHDLGGDKDYEEHVVTVLSNGLTDLLRRNPPLFDWIGEALHGEA